MNAKQTLRWTMIMIMIVGLNNCADAPQTQHNRDLTAQQKHELNQLSSKLLKSMNQTDFFKPNRNEVGNPLLHPTVSNFISSVSDQENAATIQTILDHPLFAEFNTQGKAIARTKEDEVELSQAAQDVLTNLSNEVNGYLDDFFNSADTVNFNANELAENLMAIVDNAENEVESVSGISNAEVAALLSAFQIQRDLIPSIVENANSIFETTPSGGRTKGFFKKLGRYIGSVVVSMAAGAVIGGIIGGIVGATREDSDVNLSALIGAGIGAAVGGAVGIYQATKDRCATTWDLKKTFPLIDYVPC